MDDLTALQNVAKTAMEAFHQGISVIPPAEDGTKRPAVAWKRFQSKRASLAPMTEWYGRDDRHGVGYVTGEVSGGLELLEFDDHPTYMALKTRGAELGLGDLIARVEGGYCEDTPNYGIHWPYRCPGSVGTNTKLASRPGSPTKVLIETRGEGGYFIAAPTHGPVHPTGRPYVLMSGGVATIATITPAERADLWALARTFDESMPPPFLRPAASKKATGRRRAGDAFNDAMVWENVIGPAGWTLQYESDGVGYWTKPGKTSGVSATTNFGGADLFYVFSTATAFESERSYDKFGAYALLDHGGDFTAAAAAAAVSLGMSDHRTDLGNAQLFAEQHATVLRHVRASNRWLFWDGKRWSPNATGEVERMACETIKVLHDSAAACTVPFVQREMRVHAFRTESKRGFEAMIALAKSDSYIAATPEQFDADPFLLNCLDGVVDLRTGTLLPHDSSYLMTKLAPAEYQGTFTAEDDSTWLSFLSDLTGNDRAYTDYLQACIGYSLTGSVAEEKLFLVHGPAATGKSTFVEAVRGVWGDYASAASFDTFIAKRSGGIPNDLARLVGARFVTAVEVAEGKHLDEAVVKQITGGDKLTARFLYGEFFEYSPQLKLWLAANDVPLIRPQDDGMWRRIERLPFDKVVAEKDRDPVLKKRLTSDPALRTVILRWAVEGALRWQADGLHAPPVVEQATGAYRHDMNPLSQFVDEECSLDPGARVTCDAFYEAYRQWAENNGTVPVPKGKILSYLASWNVVAVRGARGTRSYANIRALA